MTYRIINGRVSNYQTLDFNKDVNNGNVNNGRNIEGKAKSFSEVLGSKLNSNVSISKHASERLEERNIKLSEEDFKKIGNAFDKAEGKGARESVIFYKELALVASIKNRTIITAMPKSEENIFTNIDSVVLL